MNCPNCNKKPVGLFPGFRLKRVGFKQAFNGYFRCKHCGTLLEQEEESGLPKYEKPYTYIQVVFTLLILGCGLLAMYTIGMSNWSSPGVLAGLVVLLTGLIGIQDSYFRPRYWIIKEADMKSSDQKPSYKLTSQGWTIFSLYCIIAIALFLITPSYLDEADFSKWTILTGAFLYSAVVIGGAIYIITSYSTPEGETQTHQTEEG